MRHPQYPSMGVNAGCPHSVYFIASFEGPCRQGRTAAKPSPVIPFPRARSSAFTRCDRVGGKGFVEPSLCCAISRVCVRKRYNWMLSGSPTCRRDLQRSDPASHDSTSLGR